MPQRMSGSRVNYLRQRTRGKRLVQGLSGRIKKETVCPKCGWFFSLSFLARASVFSKEEKNMGGKQIVCPNCKEPLWYISNGEIQFAGIKLVVVKPTPSKVSHLRWIWCFICSHICRIIRKIRGLPPQPTN